MSRVIPADRLAAYRRWELPSMDEAPAAPVGTDYSGLAAPPPEPPVEPPEPLPRLPTLEEIEAIQREAQEEGYAAGFAEGRQAGHREGLAAAQAEIAAQAQALGGVLDFLSRPLADLDAVVEEELLHLAVAMVRQLLRRELATAPEAIVAAVREAVGMLPLGTQQVRVSLHPEDARLVREALDLGNGERPWTISEDPVLTRGGCRVESDHSRIDATVERRLDALIAAVLGHEPGQDYGMS